MTTAKVFQALADSTRLEIFGRLTKSPAAVHEIAGWFPVSRPAISQHLKVLLDAGLVTFDQDGRQRLYGPNLSGLFELTDWVLALPLCLGERVRSPVDMSVPAAPAAQAEQVGPAAPAAPTASAARHSRNRRVSSSTDEAMEQLALL